LKLQFPKSSTIQSNIKITADSFKLYSEKQKNQVAN
jgi:hypothetical protein